MKAVVFPIESDVFQSRLLTFTHFISDPEVKYLSETLTMPVKSAQTHGATTAGYKGINWSSLLGIDLGEVVYS